MGHITEKSEYAAKLAATGGSWPHHFTVVTAVDKDGVPIEAAQPTYTEIDEEDNSAGGAPVVWAYPAGVYRALNGQELQLSFGATNGGLTVGVANVTVNFYQLDDGAYFLLDTVVIANPAVVAGSMVKVRVKCEDATGATIAGATHFTVTGNISVDAACHAYFGYDLFRADMDVELEASDIEIGAVELKDATTDNRAIINDANTARNATDHVLLVQTLDALGNVVGASAGMPFISTHYAPNDFTATRINDTTVAITVGPVVMTTTNTLVAYITKKSATNVVTTYINGTGGVSLYISANDTLTLIGGTVGATDTIQSVGVRIFDKENTITTNSKRTAEISPLDTRDVLISAIASNATINNTPLYYPAAAATPTSNWDSFTLNAAGGKARRISFNGSSIPPNTKTAIITLYASNDPNATSASKRWTQIAFIDDMTGNTVTSLTMTGNAGGTAQPFAISVGKNFDYRYLVMLVTTNDNTTAVYIDGAAGY